MITLTILAIIIALAMCLAGGFVAIFGDIFIAVIAIALVVKFIKWLFRDKPNNT